ncbi:hypothetical protein FS749_006465 [Ceratobasidium sp. UAMH 11750]|nr:hypothetical protein FS749_006465 [Ceratobasidium sp. UAMH 11750]
MVILPLVILRVGLTFGWKPPPAYQFFAGVAFASSGLVNVLLFIVTRRSFIKQVAATRPQVHVSTLQIAVSEDAQGTQEIHLREWSTAPQSREQDDISEKEDGSLEMKRDA